MIIRPWIGDIAMSSDENDSDNNDNGDDDGADESESESAAVGTKWQSTHVMNQLPFTVQNPGVQIIGTAIPDSAGEEMVNKTNR